MKQELRETTQEMIRADEGSIEDILNRRPTGHYWIVIAHKITKMRMDTGEQVLMRVVKDYNTKPRKLVGTIVLEIRDGDIIKEDVFPMDAPIDWAKIEPLAGFIENPGVITDRDVAPAYIYNK